MIPTLHQSTDEIYSKLRSMKEHELVVMMSLLGFSAEDFDIERLREGIVVDLSAHPAVIFAYLADLGRGSTLMRAKGRTPAEAVAALRDLLEVNTARVKSICGER